MKIFRTLSEMTDYRPGGVGFVPTMGALHEGHLSLLIHSIQENRHTVLSIFVNPIQFNDPSDFEKYPRTESIDLELAEKAGVDVVFIPTAEEILGGVTTQIEVRDIASRWEGEHRPGHFNGVATIVCKLFNLVAPQRAYFGLKDLQQCAVVRQMVRDLNLQVDLCTVSTLRAPDGLALSSRNKRLSTEARKRAPYLYQELERCAKIIRNHREATIQDEIENSKKLLETEGFRIDYFALVDTNSLLPLPVFKPESSLIAAVYLDEIRLIDNLQI